jgi:PTS system mannose-specific IIA component
VIGLVLVSHGTLATGLLHAAQLINGEIQQAIAIGLMEMEDIDELVQRVEQAAIEVDSGEGVLILVDLFGASPFNASARVKLASPGRALDVVTGMNLPMLVELDVQRDALSLPDAVELALQIGKDGISRINIS